MGETHAYTYPHPNIRLLNDRDSGGVYAQTVGYMFRDQLGSVRGVVGGTDWIERGVYRPFGDSVEWVDPAEEPESHNYIGERRDDTGLMYLNARYYDPSLGHFLSPDWFPVTEPGVGVHRYGYSLFDPVNRLDPGGNAAPVVIGLIAVASWAFSAEGANAPTPDDIQNDNYVQPGAGTARMAGAAMAGATATTLLPSLAARCALSPGCRAVSTLTEASECVRTQVCIPGAPGASSTRIADDVVDGATSSGLRTAYEARQIELQGMLREASQLGEGNLTLAGQVTRAEATALGEAWVGPGFRTASDGRTLLSSDGTRQYRPPTPKPNSSFANTGVQLNLETRELIGSRWVIRSDAHIDVVD